MVYKLSNLLFFYGKKTGDTVAVSPKESKESDMTPYGGIIRIRFQGRSLMTSSQPAIQAPHFQMIISLWFKKCKIGDG
jgi:hypothetical protein